MVEQKMSVTGELFPELLSIQKTTLRTVTNSEQLAVMSYKDVDAFSPNRTAILMNFHGRAWSDSSSGLYTFQEHAKARLRVCYGKGYLYSAFYPLPYVFPSYPHELDDHHQYRSLASKEARMIYML